MHLRNRITAFSALGKLIRSFSEDEIHSLSRRASAHNNWFTEPNIRLSLERIITYLEKEKLEAWLASYQLPEENFSPQKIGVVFSGSFPAAGFHDFLSVLISGNHLHGKLHKQDPVLLPILAEELCQIEPEFRHAISFDPFLRGMDAMIVTETGSSYGYLELYLKNKPHLIRKKRFTCAILEGSESKEELSRLGKDMTQYFGLDTRSVSKIFVPEGFHFPALFEALEEFSYLKDHNKFLNNYDYNKSVYLVNMVPHLDTGFLLFKEDRKIVSPISVVFYETYKDRAELEQRIKEQSDIIECVIGKSFPANVPFGKANQPEPWDYVDKQDTIAFLRGL